MLKITLTNPNTQATETYDVVKEFNPMFERAKELGLISSIFGLKVKDMKDENAPIRLHADSDVGNGLLRILPENDSLYDVRVTDESVSGVREELHDDLEANLVYEQYSDTEEMYDDIKEMLKALASSKLSFFCPLTGNINDHEGDYYETSNDVLTENADAIEEAIAREQATEINMADYVSDHADIKGKLVFAEWGVEERRGMLYGKIDCYLTEELTPEETERLRDAITGQNSDGLGEGFEQREIPIDEGDLYVSYWQSGNEYFLYTEDEMNDLAQAKYYAQELKENTYNLTRMNLVMRGILPDNIVTRCGDTLDDDWPYFDDNDKENTYEPLTNLDAVVSNPPYSQKWDPSDKQHDPRFNGYGIAPKTKADYAFLLHDLYHLRAGGIKMRFVRGHCTGFIKKRVIKKY